MRTEKQWQGEKLEQRVPAPTRASSDQLDQSGAGGGQCKGSAFLPPNQQALSLLQHGCVADALIAAS